MTRVRPATHTVALIDTACADYRSVFHNVRHVEQFTQLMLGLVAETKRKSLPRLAKTVQGEPQALRHFLARAEWSVEELRHIRLGLLQQALAGRPFTLCIDETGIARRGNDRLCGPSVHWQRPRPGQWDRLGQCVRPAGHHHLSLSLPLL